MRLERKQVNGIKASAAENGIGRLVRLAGRIRSCTLRSVRIAALIILLPFLLALTTALGVVCSLRGIRTLSISEAARSAALSFLCERLAASKNSVQVSAIESIDGLQEVHNLTLDKHNVYYANDVLVENCADALMMSCFIPEIKTEIETITFEAW